MTVNIWKSYPWTYLFFTTAWLVFVTGKMATIFISLSAVHTKKLWFSYLFTVICCWSLYSLWTLAVFSFPIDAGDEVEHLVIILKKLCIQAFACQLYHICSTCLFTCWTCLWCRDSAQCLTTQTSHIYLTPLEYYTTQSHGSKHLL